MGFEMKALQKEETTQALDNLFHEIGVYKKSSDFKQLFKFIKRFPYYSPYNAHLLYMQKPGCTYVAMASTWKRDFKRTINPGARPLIILVPFGPVGYVFDLDDTEGKPFPEDILKPFKTDGFVREEYYYNLINNLPKIGIRFVEADYGSQMAGKIEKCKTGQTQVINKTTKDIHLQILYNICVNKNHPKDDIFPTILHELAHLFCGHLEDEHIELYTKRRIRKNEKEFEAECVAWLICERLGLHNPSAKYLSGYTNDNDEIPNISLDNILNAVGKIEDMMKNKNFKPIKEILIKQGSR